MQLHFIVLHYSDKYGDLTKVSYFQNIYIRRSVQYPRLEGARAVSTLHVHAFAMVLLPT
jgi:hypothetical protein